MSPPSVSIIVVSHNRQEQLLRCVRLISRMHREDSAAELVVVLDSCSDRSFELLNQERREIPIRFTLEAISRGSPGAARNHGARLASGSMLLFLDDDTLPSEQLLRSHVTSQAHSDVVVGYLKPLLGEHPDWWQLGARIWWEDRYTRMRADRYRMGFRDLFSANLSIKAELFRSAGMFDEELPRLEDYELGIRLLKAGATIRHDPEALAYHLEDGSLRRWLARGRLEAEAEVRIGNKHPDFRRELFKERLEGETAEIARWKSRVRSIAFRRKTHIHIMIGLARMGLPLLERAKARTTWRHFMGGVHEYHYWDAVAKYFQTESDFLRWVDEA